MLVSVTHGPSNIRSGFLDELSGHWQVDLGAMHDTQACYHAHETSSLKELIIDTCMPHVSAQSSPPALGESHLKLIICNMARIKREIS
jgi:hypothetical protein